MANEVTKMVLLGWPIPRKSYEQEVMVPARCGRFCKHPWDRDDPPKYCPECGSPTKPERSETRLNYDLLPKPIVDAMSRYSAEPMDAIYNHAEVGGDGLSIIGVTLPGDGSGLFLGKVLFEFKRLQADTVGLYSPDLLVDLQKSYEQQLEDMGFSNVLVRLTNAEVWH